MSYQQWIEANRQALESAYRGADCMPGEPPPCRNMKFEVFAAGRWAEEMARPGTGL